RFTVVGLFRDQPVSLPGCTTFPWQPAGPNRWETLIRRHRPQWIIHCGPLACGSWDVPRCLPDGTEHARHLALLAKISAGLGSQLTVVSSDAVFTGPRLFHDEKAEATGPDAFARAVREAERTLESTDALVVRTHPYGWSPAGTFPGFAEQVWQTLVEGKAPRCDTGRHATPMLASDLAEFLLMAYRRKLAGRYHIAGAERTSAYRFAIELATAFGLGYPLVAASEEPHPSVEGGCLRETSY
ncbi:MAG: sugar nucleotide-binding protein, partial [Planctomycetota bacterium]